MEKVKKKTTANKTAKSNWNKIVCLKPFSSLDLRRRQKDDKHESQSCRGKVPSSTLSASNSARCATLKTWESRTGTSSVWWSIQRWRWFSTLSACCYRMKTYWVVLNWHLHLDLKLTWAFSLVYSKDWAASPFFISPIQSFLASKSSNN